MKTLIALFILTFLCNGNPYYVANTVAIPDVYGTLFEIDGNVYASYDRYHGNVTVIMDSNDTDDVTDDEIYAVIERK